jgi:hypothetical protein
MARAVLGDNDSGQIGNTLGYSNVPIDRRRHRNALAVMPARITVARAAGRYDGAMLGRNTNDQLGTMRSQTHRLRFW